MVTFRFYVVSTVAFFLALSVGVVVGSVLDGRIADSLQNRLDGVEQSLDETVASIDAKNDAIDRMQRYMDESAPYAVQGRLATTATLVTAETGIAPSVAEDLVRRLRESGSRVEGVVWLDRRLDLTDEADRKLVAGLTGSPESTDTEALRAALWERVIASASVELQPVATSTTTTAPGQITTAPGQTTTPVPQDDQSTSGEPLGLIFDQSPLSELEDAGLVRFQSIDGDTTDAPASELLVTTLSGPGSTLTDPGLLSGEIATASASAGVPTVLAAAITPKETAEGALDVDRTNMLPDPGLADNKSVSTVDDLEWVAGRVATVLALADLREGRSGRYGLGADVDGILPPWQGP